MNIDSFILQNHGLFVARIHLLVRRPLQRPGEFGPVEVVQDMNDIQSGQEKHVNLGWDGYGIPESSVVRLRAFVRAGSDSDAQQSFLYVRGSGTARFVVSGTVFGSTLSLLSLPAAVH